MTTPRRLASLAALTGFAVACAQTPTDDGRPPEVPADAAREAPRPDEAVASFHFPGNNLEQREFVWLYADGSYDYAERWDMGIPGDDEKLLFDMGWDWKVGCRAEVQTLEDGTPCCTQTCTDGGDSGVAYEPPEAFSCMNRSAGGDFDWFLEGLRANGMEQLSACLPPRSAPH